MNQVMPEPHEGSQMVFSRWHVYTLGGNAYEAGQDRGCEKMRRNNLISTGTGKHHFYDDDTPKVVREGEK